MGSSAPRSLRSITLSDGVLSLKAGEQEAPAEFGADDRGAQLSHRAADLGAGKLLGLRSERTSAAASLFATSMPTAKRALTAR